MTLVLNLSPQIEAYLQAEAQTQGRTVEEMLAARLAKEYKQAKAREALGGSHPFKQVMDEFRAKHDIPDFSHLSEAEMEAEVKAAVARMPKHIQEEMFEPEDEIEAVEGKPLS